MDLREVLKDLPVTTSTVGTYGGVSVADLQKAVDRFNEVPNYKDLLEANNRLAEAIKEFRDELKFQRKISLVNDIYGVGVCDRLLNRFDELFGSDNNE